MGWCWKETRTALAGYSCGLWEIHLPCAKLRRSTSATALPALSALVSEEVSEIHRQKLATLELNNGDSTLPLPQRQPAPEYPKEVPQRGRGASVVGHRAGTPDCSGAHTNSILTRLPAPRQACARQGFSGSDRPHRPLPLPPPYPSAFSSRSPFTDCLHWSCMRLDSPMCQLRGQRKLLYMASKTMCAPWFPQVLTTPRGKKPHVAYPLRCNRPRRQRRPWLNSLCARPRRPSTPPSLSRARVVVNARSPGADARAANQKFFSARSS